VDGVGEVPQAGTRASSVPVDEGPLRVISEHKVPWSQVVVGDDVTGVSWDRLLPTGVGWGFEALDFVVELPDQRCDAGQSWGWVRM
jgi:hypothetical protein